MAEKMNQTEIERQVKRLFKKDKAALKKALKKVVEQVQEHDKWWDVKKALQRATDQPVGAWSGIREDAFNAIAKGAKKIPPLGSPSFRYEIALNRDATTGMDWDRELAESLGGSINVCVIWISALIPVYVMDVYTMGYSKKVNYYEFKPYSPNTAFEKGVITQVDTELVRAGFTSMSKTFAKKIVKNVYTEANDTGAVTIFECLFSDVVEFQEDWIRINDHELDDAMPGVQVSWREHYDESGKLQKSEVYRLFPSGDQLKTTMDAEDHIVEVRLIPSSGPLADVPIMIDMAENEAKFQKKSTKAKPIKKSTKAKPTKKTTKGTKKATKKKS